MTDFRITFSKTGPLVFISHLDLTHTFVRTFKRAGIPLRYSSGFNPHPKIVFALPLSVGTAGENELCDIGLARDMDKEEFTMKLRAALPPHIEIKSVSESTGKFNNVYSADYIFSAEGVCGICENIREFLSKDDITVEKKTKSGEKQINIKPQIFSYEVSETDGKTYICLCVNASPDGYLNPEYVMKAMESAGILSSADFNCTRTRINLK